MKIPNNFSSETKRPPLKSNDIIIKIIPTVYPAEVYLSPPESLSGGGNMKFAAPTRQTPPKTRKQPKR